jgi:ribosomal protein S21
MDNASVVVTGDIDFALKLLKKNCIKADVFGEMARRAYYLKPSVRKRNKAAKAQRKARKALVKQAEYEQKTEHVKMIRSVHRKGTP